MRGASLGQRTPRPPQVQRGWVAVADGLLAGGLLVYGVQRQRDFYELLAVCHDVSFAIRRLVTGSLQDLLLVMRV